MRDPLGKLIAAGAGALAMYYLDPRSGAERRSLLAQLLRGGMRTGRADDRARARRRGRIFHHVPSADPQRDAQLRSLIRERLDRLVSHPGAIDVQVQDGVVRLSGDVLSRERDGMLLQVSDLPGVEKLVNAMTSHDGPGGLTALKEHQAIGKAG